jgi:hypothetical protein
MPGAAGARAASRRHSVDSKRHEQAVKQKLREQQLNAVMAEYDKDNKGYLERVRICVRTASCLRCS